MIAVLVVLVGMIEAINGATAMAWNEPAYSKDYPEVRWLPRKSEVSMTLSGGGIRAYLSGIGALSALDTLGLTGKIKYLSTVSGGSWANAAYSYGNGSLGSIIPPEALTMNRLETENGTSLRTLPVKRCLEDEILSMVYQHKMNFEYVWGAAIWKVFLEPNGIELKAQTAISNSHVRKAKQRNSWLRNTTFFLYNKNKPFPIINAAVLGPVNCAPFESSKIEYTPIEFCPTYAGSPQFHIIKYHHCGNATVSIPVGGFVETFVFNGAAIKNQSFGGLAPGQSSKLLHDVPQPINQFGIVSQTAASSWAPGALLASSGWWKWLSKLLGRKVEYWSPIQVRPTSIFLADGGSIENSGLLNLLRRGCKEIIVFVDSLVPLKPNSEYKPFQRSPTDNDVDVDLAVLFGMMSESANKSVANLVNDQIFPRFRFNELIVEMQRKQGQGGGIVVRQPLQTIENSFWGIPAGRKVVVTWVYLSRCPLWEKSLPLDTQKLVIPEVDASNPSKLRQRGMFASFPHYSTQKLRYTYEQANLLTNMAGWVVLRHASLFQLAFGTSNIESEV